MKTEHHRRSIRLCETDYSVPGMYFVTICVKNRECLFGEVIDGEIRLGEYGEVAKQCWEGIPSHFLDAVIDEYVIMPNHIHGVIEIVDHVGAENFLPLQPKPHGYQRVTPRSIASIVRGFKIGVTKWWRENGYEGGLWQRNYYEHIIRNDKSLNQIRQYIRDNPFNWGIDENNPVCIARKIKG